ncbi:hypothetical protein MG293_016965 [Ovis ammon polii]|uniref:Uncharacterized protein n=1 Tax=Ovis ammon polii TaxID=230172 RepID=A0AAD4TV60_OVIAM|nr:hypothetical protein MG293_016965 [Ovis ammon polii]
MCLWMPPVSTGSELVRNPDTPPRAGFRRIGCSVEACAVMWGTRWALVLEGDRPEASRACLPIQTAFLPYLCIPGPAHPVSPGAACTGCDTGCPGKCKSQTDKDPSLSGCSERTGCSALPAGDGSVTAQTPQASEVPVSSDQTEINPVSGLTSKCPASDAAASCNSSPAAEKLLRQFYHSHIFWSRERGTALHFLEVQEKDER